MSSQDHDRPAEGHSTEAEAPISGEAAAEKSTAKRAAPKKGVSAAKKAEAAEQSAEAAEKPPAAPKKSAPKRKAAPKKAAAAAVEPPEVAAQTAEVPAETAEAGQKKPAPPKKSAPKKSAPKKAAAKKTAEAAVESPEDTQKRAAASKSAEPELRSAEVAAKRAEVAALGAQVAQKKAGAPKPSEEIPQSAVTVKRAVTTQPAAQSAEVAPQSAEVAPEISIVIPVYNEEGILAEALDELIAKLEPFGWRYEIIVAENGSTDETVAIAEAFTQSHAQVRSFSVGEPNYGKALKEGILRARGTFVICDEIDLCDTDFYQIALELLRQNQVDFVVGSKRAQGARDRRPAYRRAATHVLNGMLRVAVGFKGTDTHGLKAFRREPILPIVQACVVDRDMFASELVVRVHRADARWAEVPIDLVEKRPPSIHLFKRVPNVLKNIVRLTAIIRLGRDLR